MLKSVFTSTCNLTCVNNIQVQVQYKIELQHGTADRMWLGWIGKHIRQSTHICYLCKDLCTNILSWGNRIGQSPHAGLYDAELGIKTMGNMLTILKLTKEPLVSPASHMKPPNAKYLNSTWKFDYPKLLRTHWLHDSIPSQPTLYKPHPKWVAAAQHRDECLHHQNTKIVERYDRHTHNLFPLQMVTQ